MSDLINRQAAIDTLAEMHCKSDEDGYVWIIRSDAWARIDALPSAEKKGKWLLTEDDDYEYCTCSECGYQNGENWMNGSDIPFCAMCGADMRGKEDA